MNDKSNITIGLPKSGGAIYWAPAGTKLPTDATTALDKAFVNLGYVSEDGLTVTTADDGEDKKAWGPETVMHAHTDFAKTYTFNLLETSKEAVLQFVFGKNNVSVQTDGSLKWEDTGEPLPRGILVCETLHSNGNKPRVHRQILGDAQFTDRSGDQTYNNSDLLQFPVVVTAYKFTSGDKQVYETNYLEAVATS